MFEIIQQFDKNSKGEYLWPCCEFQFQERNSTTGTMKNKEVIFMAQENIKDIKIEQKTKVKENKKDKMDDKKEEHKKEETTKTTSQKPQRQAIQLTPQEAYKFFNDEKRKLEHIVNDLQKTESAIHDLDKSIYVLNELKDSKDKEMFVHLGLGIYVKAKLDNLKKYFVLDSSKAMFPKTAEKILEELKKKKAKALDSAKRLQSLHMQTERNINQLYKFLSHYEQQQRNKQQ